MPTENYGLPTIGPSNTADIPRDMNALAEAVDDELFGKVDKEPGKGLSTNDYTNAEKTKLTGIETGAEVNDVKSVAGKTGAVTLAVADVGGLQDALNARATTADVGTKSSLNTSNKTNLVAAINETFQYANDGKTAVASAVTAKGVSASPTDTFSQLATKIGQIQTGQLKKSLLLSDGSGVSKQFRYPNGSNAINQVYYTLLKSEIGFDPDVLIVSGTTVNPDHFVYQKEGFLEKDGVKAHALATAPNYTSNSPNTYLLRKDEIDTGDRFHVPIMTTTGAKSYIAIKYTQ